MSANKTLVPDDEVDELSYHCVLYNIPFDLAVSKIVEYILPPAESAFLTELKDLQVQLITRQLCTYKEQLDTKFGFFDYVILSENKLEREAKLKVHRLVLDWIAQGLMRSLQAVECSARLAQPSYCHSASRFLEWMGQHCKIVTPEYTKDPQKIRTFLLSHVHFLREKDSETGSREVEGNGVATFSVSCLAPKEIVWLKRTLLKFPPILVTNGDLSTTRVDPKQLLDFFHQALGPLIRVCVSSVSNPIEIGGGDEVKEVNSKIKEQNNILEGK
ncbi:unnamed protein product [Phytomonas sp. Hart1]|nr:unnamed protein product [Phytomonas sp. Hart1]|eukprot:CCW70610.1 unnamed protein product [Phytomonas sp. isolate Hart1]